MRRDYQIANFQSKAGGEKTVFPNLSAEQARRGKTDDDIATVLNISRVSYGAKKRDGRFSITEANALCDYFGCPYVYLFCESVLVPTNWTELETMKT